MSSVQSIERAFAILEVVAGRPEGIGITEIAQRVHLPKSTVARLLGTLEAVTAVERLPDGQGVRLGPKMLALAQQLPYSRHLITLARPYLLELAEATGEAVSLCLPDGDQAYYVDHVPSRHHVQVRDWTGYRFPLHVVSAGKLFLAFGDEAVREGYLARPLTAYTAHTLTDPQQLRQQLAEIQQQGIAWTLSEFEEGLNAVSAPIQAANGQIIAALTIYGPAFRFPVEGVGTAVAQHLLEVCARVSERMRR
jgi:DNA-binding IclR family transcriptional regulator